MLIGLTGRAQAGKDTVYKVMADRYLVVRNVQRRAFADLLYRSAAAALDCSVELLRELKIEEDAEVVIRDASKARRTISVRRYLQNYGTEAHRDIFGADFWVDALDLTHGLDDLVVVTDVRFPNEAHAITKMGGHVVRVEGPYVGDDDDHASEQPIPDALVDYVLDNTCRDDGMASLRRNVAQLLLDIAARERWA